MYWYKYLYADESIEKKKNKIKWKINHNAGQMNIYIITLPPQEGRLLEIIPAYQLLQKAYPKQQLFVVGLARGYEAATELACRIILEVYKATGAFRVREYLLDPGRNGGGEARGRSSARKKVTPWP